MAPYLQRLQIHRPMGRGGGLLPACWVRGVAGAFPRCWWQYRGDGMAAGHHSSSVPISARHTSLISTVPSRPARPTTGR